MATKKKANLAASWRSVTDFKEAIARSRETHAKASDRLANFDRQVAKRREDLEATLRDLSPNERSSMATRAAQGLRAELKRNSEQERKKSLRELSAIHAGLRGALVHYQSAAQMLAREGLGSERRSRIMQQVAASGPAEMASLASFAAATGDKEMAAALNARVSQMAPKDRPFSPHDLADALMGQEWREVQVAAMEAERLMLEAVTQDGAFETGKPNPNRSVRLAMMQRAEAEMAEPQPEQEQN